MTAMETPPKKTLVYALVADLKLRMDIHEASGQGGPIMMMIHGGGLIFGSRGDILSWKIHYFKERGWNVFVPDYRLAPESTLEEILEDITAAYTWMRSYAQKAGMDIMRIHVLGYSAGGYLALHTARFSPMPNAIVSFYGYGDLTEEWCRKPNAYYSTMRSVPADAVDLLVGGAAVSEGHRLRALYYVHLRQKGMWMDRILGEEPPSLLALQERSPVYNLSKSHPPVLLIHGKDDRDVPFSACMTLKNAFLTHGTPHEVICVEKAGHEFDLHGAEEKTMEVYYQVETFLHGLRFHKKNPMTRKGNIAP